METKTTAAAAPEKPEKKKRTKVVRVDEWHIDWLLRRPPRPPRPWNPPDDVLNGGGGGAPVSQEQLERRAAIARCDAKIQAYYDRDMATLQQYHDMGYAVEEVEVEDDA